MYYEDESNPKDSRTHIRVLIDFLESCGMPNVSELIALCDPTKVIHSVSYASLWLLFPPSTLFMNQKPDNDRHVFFLDTAVPPQKALNEGQFEFSGQRFKCRAVKYDGEDFYNEKHNFMIGAFDGLRPLAELEFLPLNMLEDPEKEREGLVARGRKFWNLRGLHVQEVTDDRLSNASLAVSLANSFSPLSSSRTIDIGFFRCQP